MSNVKNVGFGAIGAGALALTAIVFSNIETTKSFLVTAQASGGTPKMLADLILNPAFQVILVVVCLVLSVKAVHAVKEDRPQKPSGNSQAARKKAWDSQKQNLEEVYARNFLNEIVGLDGKRFKDCTFAHCKLQFHGYAPFAVDGCTIKTGTRLETDVPQIMDWADFSALASRGALLAGMPVQTGFSDAHGNLTPRFEERPLPKKPDSGSKP